MIKNKAKEKKKNVASVDRTQYLQIPHSCVTELQSGALPSELKRLFESFDTKHVISMIYILF